MHGPRTIAKKLSASPRPSFRPISPAWAMRCSAVIAAGADWIHFDVMDNHYVPEPDHRADGGAQAMRARRRAKIPIDVHLMVQPVDALGGRCSRERGRHHQLPSGSLATMSIARSQLIREHGCRAGLVLNPATPLNVLDYVMDRLDLMLLMSVNPGFGGQSFIPRRFARSRAVRALIDAHAASGGRSGWRSMAA